jgi:hypothetical protein
VAPVTGWVKSTRSQAVEMFCNGATPDKVMKRLGIGTIEVSRYRKEAMVCKRCGEQLAQPVPDRTCGFCRSECEQGAAWHGKAAVL